MTPHQHNTDACDECDTLYQQGRDDAGTLGPAAERLSAQWQTWLAEVERIRAEARADLLARLRADVEGLRPLVDYEDIPSLRAAFSRILDRAQP